MFEQDLGCMMTKIENLQTTILKNQEASERKFNDLHSKSQAQFAKVLDMFTRMEKNFKKTTHGKGSAKSQADNKQIVSESDDEGEDGVPKKRKVPYREGEDPDQAQAAIMNTC
jgi:hypothetical protein